MPVHFESGDNCFKSMIDIDLFRKILKEEDGYIEYGDTIPLELFELMCSSPIDKVKSLFKKYKGRIRENNLYLVYIKCTECGRVFPLEVSKTKLFNLISKCKNKYLCLDCKSKEYEIEKERDKLRDAERELDCIKNTETYISSYLNPNNCWNKNVPYYTKFKRIRDVFVNWGTIKEYIRNMDYYDFLETPYWKAVSEKVKSRANYKCQICNSSNNLCAHHRSYANHGDEVHNLNDLICICKDCHTKHHFE